MDKQLDDLAGHIYRRASDLTPERRFLVAIAGIPGSGKTTFATEVVNRINRLAKEARKDTVEVAKLVGLDGWHYPRSVLDQFPDPKEAHARRGAPFTFDSPSYSFFVSLLSLPLPSTTSPSSPHSSASPTYPSLPLLAAPSFSHKNKDPVALDIPIATSHKIVVFEGLYCLTKVDAWEGASAKIHERVLVTVDKQTARKRLAQRHLESGICQTLEEGEQRADVNDLPNGDWLLENALEPTWTIQSIADPAFGNAPT